MWNGNNNFGGYSSCPGAPYYGGYNAPLYQQQSNQQLQQSINTNKIYVNGIDDVRSRQLPAGSDFIFLDNDKPIIYQKVVDGKGQFEVKAFSITPYSAQEDKNNSQVDLSGYAKTTDLDPIRAELKSIKEQLITRMEDSNGAGKESL